MDIRKARPSAAGEPRDATPAGGLGEARLQHLIGYQVAQAAIVTFGVFERLVGGPMELRPVEYTILTLIDENPGGSPAQLSKALAVTPPNITSWVDKLERRGLVARERNLRDRRGRHLRTTEAGAALVREATARLLEGERETLSTLTPGERLILGELLHKVARLR
ncbi:MarR family winged helix-turn-helix transcriptional regulator [Piscinibacter koreensis]|uniref:MarR family transcriptional regulator n=1 Tax=Piscinibacter koreensis TaxID=2742824 RepID=A0A7Y6NKE8_9BURK|nr:MarR family transcriptional regulator [Schlegelella koreensis]NUZ04816.1 MarR family transcriptional regulator [Schlegelella koreensis]